MSIRVEVLTAAEEAVSTLRNSAYGEPEDSFSRIASYWNEYLFQKNPDGGLSLKPHDIALMMVLMKVARLGHDPTHYDSAVDIAGYAACAAETAGARRKEIKEFPMWDPDKYPTNSMLQFARSFPPFNDAYADNVNPQEEMP